MGKVYGSLDKLLKLCISHFVHNQRQNDRSRECQQVQPADDQCIAKHGVEFGILEERLKMLQSHPLASQNPHVRIVILESHQKPPHGEIIEKQHQQQSGQPQQIDPSVLIEPPAETFLPHIYHLRLRRQLATSCSLECFSLLKYFSIGTCPKEKHSMYTFFSCFPNDSILL